MIFKTMTTKKTNTKKDTGKGKSKNKLTAADMATLEVKNENKAFGVKLTEDDLVYDLGCGDGRFVVTAAERYGCRAWGVDVEGALAAVHRHVPVGRVVVRAFGVRVHDNQ